MRQKLKENVHEEEDVNVNSEADSAIRKIRPVVGSETVILVLPKKQVEKLHIKKGDYAKVSIHDGNKLLVEKVQV